MSGTITDVAFLGEIGQLTVLCDNVSLTAFELHPPARQAGDTITLTVAPEDVIVLAT